MVEPETDEGKKEDQIKEMRKANASLYWLVEDEKNKSAGLQSKAEAYKFISDMFNADNAKPTLKLNSIKQNLKQEKE